MRMPLNTTGVPLLLDTAATWITILDNSDMPEATSEDPRFLTLFALAASTAAPATTVLTLRAVNTDTGVVASLGTMSMGSAGFAYTRLFSQYPLRGNVRIQAQTSLISPEVYLFGYYEIASTDQRPQTNVFPGAGNILFDDSSIEARRSQRLLQPSLGTFSIASLPTSITGVGQEVVQEFSTEYLDEVDLQYQGYQTGVGTSTTELWVYDGGTRIAMMRFDTQESVVNIFQGIPMKAAAIPSILLPALSAGIHIVTSAATDRIVTWGRFLRA